MDNEFFLIWIILFIPSVIICSISWILAIRYTIKQNRKILASVRELLKEKSNGC